MWGARTWGIPMSLSILLMACGGGGGVSGGSSSTGSETSSDAASVDDVSGATETPEADGAGEEEPAAVAPLPLSCTQELECDGGLHWPLAASGAAFWGARLGQRSGARERRRPQEQIAGLLHLGGVLWRESERW